MKLIFAILIFSSSLNAWAFDIFKLDKAISTFLHSLDSAKCGDVKYSYLFANYVGLGLKKGFYGNADLSKLVPPIYAEDIDVAIKTDVCGWEDGYGLFVRRGDNDEYKIVSYSSFSQPE